MGFLDKLKGMTSKAVDQHGDKISKGVSKAGDLVDKKTGGKYTDKIKKGEQKVDDSLDSLDGKNDDIR
jgi:hypothetical protein